MLKNLKVVRLHSLKSAIFLRFYLSAFASVEELYVCFDWESDDNYMVRLFEFKELLFKMDIKNLRKLDISGSLFLSEELYYLASLNQGLVPKLQVLELRDCKNIIH